MRNSQLALASFGIALVVSGCGGGGSGSTGGSGGGVPTAAVQITPSNAAQVAGSSHNAAKNTSHQGGSTATTVVGAVTQQSGHLPSVLNIATNGLNLALNTKLPPAMVVGATQSATYDCSTNQLGTAGAANTFTMTASVAGNSIAAGDSVTLSFNACVQSGTTTNGSMTLAIASLTGTWGTVGSSSNFKATFANLSVKDNATGATQSINGDMSILGSSKTNASGIGVTTTAAISGSSLTLSDSTIGTLQLTSYVDAYATDSGTTAYAYASDMTVGGTVIGGSVTIKTTAPFAAGVGTSNPTQGSMTISGAGGSYVTVTANSNGTDVTLTGFDGTANFGPTVVPWTAL